MAHADGTRGWQIWVCHAIEAAPEEPRELQAIGYDITDRKRAEESGRQLAQATRFAAVGELTAMVAHEINQPLCAILSNAEAAEIMLRAEHPPLEELREILADIRKDDLRADERHSRYPLIAAATGVRTPPVDLVATIHHVFKLIGGDALHRRVTIRRDLARRSATRDWRPFALEQVLVILIVNAHGCDEGDARSLRASWWSPLAARDDGFVEVTVRDRGHGIAAANMAQLFESFFTTKADGMGLGLSIARSMIDAHGGRIWAENAPDGGAAFRFTLAVAQIPAIS